MGGGSDSAGLFQAPRNVSTASRVSKPKRREGPHFLAGQAPQRLPRGSRWPLYHGAPHDVYPARVDGRSQYGKGYAGKVHAGVGDRQHLPSTQRNDTCMRQPHWSNVTLTSTSRKEVVATAAVITSAFSSPSLSRTATIPLSMATVATPQVQVLRASSKSSHG